MTVEALKAANVTTPSFEVFPPGLTVNIPCTVPTPTTG
jgi:hypothetical protein